MSTKNNPVMQVLVTKGNKAPLAKDKRVTDLEPGQIGVFDYETNLSLDTSSAKPRNFYIAVGLDTDGDGVIDDIAKSRGSHIQNQNITHYNYRAYTPGRAMKVKFKDYTVKEGEEYGLKIDFKNQEIYRMMGFTPFVKSYVTKVESCKPCKVACAVGDDNIITRDLFIQISNDPAQMLKLKIVPRGEVTAAGVNPQNGELTLEDLDKIIAYNAKQQDPTTFVHTDLEIEVVPLKVAKYCGINLNYFYPRESIIRISKVGDFKCSGVIEVTQTPVFEEGNGYDVREMEQFTQGWDVSPYRTSAVTGFPDQREYNTDKTAKYDLVHLAYEEKSQSAWLKYRHDEATTIAIPCADTTTRDGLIQLLDSLHLVPFDALADDAQNATEDPSDVYVTSAIDDVKKDGLA